MTQKYTVYLYYHGCYSAEIEAENAEEALDKARINIAQMDNNEFCDATEPMEVDHDVCWQETLQ